MRDYHTSSQEQPWESSQSEGGQAGSAGQSGMAGGPAGMGAETGPETGQRTWTERIEMTGNDLLARFQELIQEGNVRRVIIRRPGGEILLEVPLTPAVAVGGVLTVMHPVLMAIGALAAALAKVQVEVVRSEDPDKPS